MDEIVKGSVDESPMVTDSAKHFSKKAPVLARYPTNVLPQNFSSRMTAQLTQGPNERIYSCLPYDILLIVFSMLPTHNLQMASKVCKLWRHAGKLCLKKRRWIILKDQVFGDPLTHTGVSKDGDPVRDWKVLWNNKEQYYFKSLTLKCIPTRQEWDLRFSNHQWHCRTVEDEQKQKQAVTTFGLLIHALDKHLDLLRSFWKFLQVLTTRFEQKVRNGEDISGVIPAIFEAVQTQHLNYIRPKIPPFIGNKEAVVPQKSGVPTRQPPGLNKGINLYKYQLDAVRWMKSIEEDIDAIPWRSAKTEVLFDLNKQLCVPIEKMQEHIKEFYPKGGVLADEMGLGKTMEVLGLILSNPSPDKTDDDTNQQDSKSTSNDLDSLRFDSKATIVICPNHLIQQWHDEIENNTNPPLKVLTFDSVQQLKVAGYQNITQADVVVVSLQLLKYAGYINIGKKKAKANTKKKVNDTARTSRVTAQIKKVRKSMEKGEKVTDAPMLEHFRWHRFIVDEAHEVMGDDEFQDIFSNFHSKYYWYVSGTPIPNEACLNGILEFLEFPFVPGSTDHLQYIFADLLWNNLYWRNTKESAKDEYQVPNVEEELVLLEFTDVEKALYRDLPDAGKRELCSKIPSIGSCQTLTDIRDFKMDEKLRAIRKMKSDIFGKRQELAKQQEKVKDLEQEIAKVEKPPWNVVSRLNEQRNHMQYYQNTLQTAQMKLDPVDELFKMYQKCYGEKAQRIARGLTSSLSSSKSVDNINNNNNIASIEDDSDSEEEILPTEDQLQKMTVAELKEFVAKFEITPGTTKYELLTEALFMVDYFKSEEGRQERRDLKKRKRTASRANKNNKKQKTELLEEEVMDIDVSTLDKKTQRSLELAKLVETLGTKMANLVFYLRTLWEKSPDSRVIIFSQFDSVLDEVGYKVLEPQGIQFVFVKGKAAQKIEALNSFQNTESSVRVILLSLAKAASGSNLIQASHVILLDPITGKKEEVQAAEAQAIGRAYRQGQTEHVTVVRFLIKESIEHTLYLKYLQKNDTNTNGIQSVAQKVNQELNSSMQSKSLLRSSSVTTILANAPVSAQNGQTVVELLEKIEPVTKEIEQSNNNTNETKQV